MENIPGPGRLVGLISLLLILAACTSLVTPEVETEPAQLRAGEYRLDKDHATLLFKVGHLGLSQFVGRFNDFDATLDFDPSRIEDARLGAVIRTASIDVNNPEFEAELRGRNWFNSEVYPEAVFRTTGAGGIDENSASFIGELTLLGVTAPVVLDVVFHGGANNLLTLKYTLGFSASAQILRSEFGMERYIPAASDEVTIEIYAEFMRQ